jgi:hypothetical protein
MIQIYGKHFVFLSNGRFIDACSALEQSQLVAVGISGNAVEKNTDILSIFVKGLYS